MPSPFITEPESPIYVEENSMRKLVWEIIDCNWEMRVITEEYILYPIIAPELQSPIKMITDYNVTVTCVEDHKLLLNISISFNENVLENSIKFIVCRIFKINGLELKFESRVNFTTDVPFSSSITKRILRLKLRVNIASDVDNATNATASTNQSSLCL